MEYLKVVFPNTILAVPTSEISYANYSSTKIQKKFFEKVISMLGEHFFRNKPQETLQYTKLNKK